MADKLTAVIVPGVMHCAKCKFVLTRRTLNVNCGTVSDGNNKTEPCPNGCGPLWPYTWKQMAESYGERLEKQFDEIQKLKAALSATQGVPEYKCFHCKQSYKGIMAEEHFGKTPDETAKCVDLIERGISYNHNHLPYYQVPKQRLENLELCREALQNLMNGIETGAVKLETYADETLADALRRINLALKGEAPTAAPMDRCPNGCSICEPEKHHTAAPDARGKRSNEEIEAQKDWQHKYDHENVAAPKANQSEKNNA